jgi:3',5'-nucleoside bisphosphate phosphatase
VRADFHVHSTASDGTLAPSQLVTLAADRGLAALAIADHDTVAGLAEGFSAASDRGVRLVPAVELSAVHGDIDVHVLAYFVDPHDRAFLDMLSTLRDARRRRAAEIVAALEDAGYSIDAARVLAGPDGDALGRVHIARELVRSGHAPTTAEAFQRFIGRGRPFYRAKDSASPTEVVARVGAQGALPVVAHPGVTGVDDLIPELIRAGLRGIEAYHGDHTAAQKAHYARMAAEFGLLATGGSDYHGPDAPNAELGSVEIPAGDVSALLMADPGA